MQEKFSSASYRFKECSDIFNDQFHSVFNPKPPTPPPPPPLSLGSLWKMKLQDLLDAGHSLLFTGSPHSPMQDIEISDKGIETSVETQST